MSFSFYGDDDGDGHRQIYLRDVLHGDFGWDTRLGLILSQHS